MRSFVATLLSLVLDPQFEAFTLSTVVKIFFPLMCICEKGFFLIRRLYFIQDRQLELSTELNKMLLVVAGPGLK